jgi:aspartoacylase
MNENQKSEQIQRLALVGGTHGNELTGVELVRWFESHPEVCQNRNFQTEFHTANPWAIELCRRYVEKDLNRCFSQEILDGDGGLWEMRRARVLNQKIGPKGSEDAADLVVDLHNTTSNMGLCLIVSQFEDPFIRAACGHLAQLDPWVKIYHQPEGARDLNPYLPSMGKRDLTIEVGPQAHGTLNAELWLRTKQLVLALMDFIENWNQGNRPEPVLSEVYRHQNNLDFPRDGMGKICAMIHPDRQFKDYQEVKPGDPLFLGFDGRLFDYEGSESMWPVFINEAAYYEKRLALSTTQRVMESL